MIRLHVLRHGQPAWNVEGRAVDDPGLTDVGAQEVEDACRALAAQRFDTLYVSPMRRALSTAQPLAAALGLPMRICDWLAELGQPPFQGRPWEEVEAAYLAAQARAPSHWWDGLPGGEPFRDFHRRVVDGVEGLLTREWGAAARQVEGYRMWSTPERDVSLLLVCHGGTAGVLLSHLLELEVVPWIYERFPLRTGGSLVLETRELSVGQVWMLARFEGSRRLY